MNSLPPFAHPTAWENAAMASQPRTGFHQPSTGMDVARPDLARRHRRLRWLWSTGGLAAVAALTFFLAQLEPALPSVERATLWTNAVQRGRMIRQVRGNGILVPEQIQYVQADAGGTVERIHIQPGAEVAGDTVLLELGNPELKQQAFDAEWQVRAAEAQLTRLTVTLESDRLLQESSLATLRADAQQASLEFKANAALASSGLLPGLELEKTRARADDLFARVGIEERRLRFAGDSARSQLAVQEAEVEKQKALRDLRNRQVAALTVRAGIEGVLIQLGDPQPLQIGQRVSPSATLAKVVVPSRLKAEIRIMETQARDIARGQHVDIDTRNGIVPGAVVRIDPAVQNGTVLVEVRLNAPPPRGARPDLSVEGTIELDRLEETLFVGRPVQGQPESTVGLFKLVDGGRHALRVPVRFGRSSVSTIEILDGLQPGDVIVLNDMSQHDAHDKLRIQ